MSQKDRGPRGRLPNPGVWPGRGGAGRRAVGRELRGDTQCGPSARQRTTASRKADATATIARAYSNSFIERSSRSVAISRVVSSRSNGVSSRDGISGRPPPAAIAQRMVARAPCHPQAGRPAGRITRLSRRERGAETVPGRTSRTVDRWPDRPVRQALRRPSLCEKAARPHAEVSEVTVAQASLWFRPAPGLT